MKKTKRFISFLLVVQMMLMCMLIPGVAATDVVTETLVESENAETVLAMPADLETEISVEGIVQDELLPMAASGCIYYRYGSSYEPRAIDLEWIEGGDYLTTTCGLSVNTNPNITTLINRYGPAQAVNYIPSGLYFYHTSGTHYVIAPAYPMTEAQYRMLCRQIW